MRRTIAHASLLTAPAFSALVALPSTQRVRRVAAHSVENRKIAPCVGLAYGLLNKKLRPTSATAMTLSVVTWIGHDDAARAQRLREALVAAGYRMVSQSRSLIELRRATMMAQPDVMVLDVEAFTSALIDDIAQLYRERPMPIVAFVDRSDVEITHAAVRAGISSYVIDGFSAKRVRPVVEAAIARFIAWRSLEHQRESATAELAERKVVERAKGILMRRRNLPEDGAYQALRKMAMDRNKRLSQIAQGIIDAEALLASR